MFNIGAGELIVILIIALIVLGPDKLPDAIRRAGQLYGELRRMSSGFQAELRDVLDEPMREVRSTTDLVKGTFTSGIDGRDEDGDVPAPSPGKATKLLTDADAAAAPDEVAPASGDDDQLDAVAGDRPMPLPPPGTGQAAALLPPPGQGASAAPLPPPGTGS